MARTDLEPGAEPEVLAAGGVVVRGDGDEPRVAAVLRPAYGDWSLPKGKLDPGEPWEDAALREVAEEAGVRCRLGRELSPVRYRDREGRRKLVRYWLMHPLSGLDDFAAHDEVSELRWLTAAEADGLLTHEHDRELVREALGAAR